MLKFIKLSDSSLISLDAIVSVDPISGLNAAHNFLSILKKLYTYPELEALGYRPKKTASFVKATWADAQSICVKDPKNHRLSKGCPGYMKRDKHATLTNSYYDECWNKIEDPFDAFFLDRALHDEPALYKITLSSYVGGLGHDNQARYITLDSYAKLLDVLNHPETAKTIEAI